MTDAPKDAIPVDEFQPEGAIHVNEFKAEEEHAKPIPVDEFEPADAVHVNDFKPAEGAYDTPMQQAITGLEGAAQGFAGPLATGAERLLGVPKEDIAGRQEANPGIHGMSQAAGLTAGLFSPVGEANLIAKGVSRLLPEVASVYSKIGMAALSSGIQMGAIQGGDELSKAMLDQGNQEVPVSSILLHIGAAGLLGSATGGLFSAIGLGASKGLSKLESAKIGTRAEDLLAGTGMAAKAHQSGVPEEEVADYITKQIGKDNYKFYKEGVEFYYKGLKGVANATGMSGLGTVGGSIGYKVGNLLAPGWGGISGASTGSAIGAKLADKYMRPFAEKLLNRPLIGMSKLATPVLMKALSVGQTTGLFEALNYASKCSKGAQSANEAVEALFKGGMTPAINAVSRSRDEDKIRDYIDEGGLSQQQQKQQEQTPQFAEGGQVDTAESNPVASLYPTQNILLNTAKGRVATYLSSMKPQEQTKLAFDKKHKDEAKHRSYDQAIKLAARPLSILNHVKDGSLTVDHAKHMQAMYPEVYQHLRDKVVARISKAQIDEKHSMPFKTRQAMSLFLGAPLESAFAPQNILAAQAVFAQNNQPRPQIAKPKKSTAPLNKVSKSYQTADQAGEADKARR